MKPKQSSKTPDAEDTNALIAAHETLIDHFNNPSLTNRHIAIVELGVTQVVRVEGGDEQATYISRHIELLSGTQFAQQAEDLLLAAYKARTHNNALPSNGSDTPLDMPGVGDPWEQAGAGPATPAAIEAPTAGDEPPAALTGVSEPVAPVTPIR
jgi:hypothetical protein